MSCGGCVVRCGPSVVSCECRTGMFVASTILEKLVQSSGGMVRGVIRWIERLVALMVLSRVTFEAVESMVRMNGVFLVAELDRGILCALLSPYFQPFCRVLRLRMLETEYSLAHFEHNFHECDRICNAALVVQGIGGIIHAAQGIWMLFPNHPLLNL
jgi:hypothetical protein